MGQTSLKAKGFSSLKIRSREVRSAVVFEKKENWPQPEKPKKNLHWKWVLQSRRHLLWQQPITPKKIPQYRFHFPKPRALERHATWQEARDKWSSVTGPQRKRNYPRNEEMPSVWHPVCRSNVSVQGWRRPFQSSHHGKDGDQKQPWVEAPQIFTDCNLLSHAIMHTAPSRCLSQSKIISFISLVFYRSSTADYRDVRALSVLLTTIASPLRMMPRP